MGGLEWQGAGRGRGPWGSWRGLERERVWNRSWKLTRKTGLTPSFTEEGRRPGLGSLPLRASQGRLRGARYPLAPLSPALQEATLL